MPYTHALRATEHPVKSVTIFKSSTAEVVRTFSLGLKAGENRIEVKGLSSHIDTESARISGLGDGVRLFDVVCTVKAPLYPDANDPSEVVRRLNLQRQELETEKRVRQHEADILINYGKTLKGDHVSPEQASAFLDIFVQNSRENMKSVTKLTEDVTQLDHLIAQQQDKIAERQGQTNGEVVLTVSARAAGPAELKLTYMVNYAAWEPTYDMHASTEDGRPSSTVTLHYRARIMQSTGEDWKDTALTLSTSASDASGKGVPVLKSLRVTYAQHQQQAPPWNQVHLKHSAQNERRPRYDSRDERRRSRERERDVSTRHRSRSPSRSPSRRRRRHSPSPSRSRSRGPTRIILDARAHSGGWFGSGPGEPTTVPTPQRVSASAPAPGYGFGGPTDSDDEFEEVPPPGPVTEPTTVVSESPLSMTYTVEGKSTIPSDGIPHQVLVASLPFETDVTYVAVPRVETVAYLQCEVKNTSDYRLLPGPVSVFLDESFVSKTRIQDVNTGETFQCTLGADPSIRLTFVRTSSTGAVEGGAFAEQFKTTTYRATTTVRNKHRFALTRLLVRDSVPLVPLDDKRTRVVLRKPAGLADAVPGADVTVEGVVVRWANGEEGKNGVDHGKMEWEAKVESGGEVKLELEYEVRGPAEAYWVLKAE